jgi:hypothetical protein
MIYASILYMILLMIIPSYSWRIPNSMNTVRYKLSNRNHKISNYLIFQYKTSETKLRSVKAEITPNTSEFINFLKLAFRVTWLSWWAQIILTVISSVILTFANTVRTCNGCAVRPCQASNNNLYRFTFTRCL